jgi:hypothetical protein
MKENECNLSRPLQYQEVIKYQEDGCANNRWPLSYELDLNDDGIDEIFLGVTDYSRGMSYALFSNYQGEWGLISEDKSIPSGHLGIEKLENTNLVWHDFFCISA